MDQPTASQALDFRDEVRRFVAASLTGAPLLLPFGVRMCDADHHFRIVIEGMFSQ